jgi:hypothetical protein
MRGNDFKRYIEPCRTFFGIRKHSLVHYPSWNINIRINNIQLAILNQSSKDLQPFDLAVISGTFKPAELRGPGPLIIDGTNGKKKIAQWKSISERVSADYHFTGTEGAFVKSFN